MPDIELEEELDKALLPQSVDGVNSAALIKQGNDITKQIIDEDDPQKVEDLSQLFALVSKKKNIARTNRLSNLLELIDDEVITRFTETPELFDNDQLEKYMRTTQQSIYNIDNAMQNAPQIQINNQTNVNINSSGLNRESRAKVLEAVQEILNSSLQGTNNDDIIDIVPKEGDDA